MSSSKLRTLAPGVHVAEATQRFSGLSVGARMTVLELTGGLLVHSPVAIDPAALGHLGAARWVLAPNLLHHLHVGTWVAAGLEAWAAPGLPDKRPDIRFHGVVETDTCPFGSDIRLLALQCFPFTNEVVLLHRPSRTLVVADLVFNFPPTAPWLTRAAMWCLCGYPGCRTTLLERAGMHRPTARQELRTLAEWDFDRVIMAHGDIIETGGKAAMLNAFRWL
ncbi:MAG: hypothetical protein OXU20_41230 [Myxococcales bacterium]|nr:hypothetical protein [Myxococcales bacterium]